MKTCCLVWEIPVIEGEHYNPIMNVIYMQKAKKFLNQLNRYFQDENMDWKCVLDHSVCTYNEIFSSEHQAVIFAPEAKTRQWLYKKDFQKKDFSLHGKMSSMREALNVQQMRKLEMRS